jgi:hypothetical protein
VHVTYSEPAGAAARRPEPARRGPPPYVLRPVRRLWPERGRSGGPGPSSLQHGAAGWPERRTQWRARVVRPAAGAAAVGLSAGRSGGPGSYVLRAAAAGVAGAQDAPSGPGRTSAARAAGVAAAQDVRSTVSPWSSGRRATRAGRRRGRRAAPSRR